MDSSGAVGAIFPPVGTWTEQRPAAAATLAFVLVKQRRFQLPVQRQDSGPKIFADQRPGNALDADTSFLAIVQQQAIPGIVVTALVYQPLNTLKLTVGQMWYRILQSIILS